MSYQPPGNDNSEPAPSPYAPPAPDAGHYGPQPHGGYLPLPPSGYPAPGPGGYAENPAHPPQPYGYPPPYGYGYPQQLVPRPTNGMAIASLVVSGAAVLGLCGYGLGGYLGIVGVILGHVGRRQLRERGESGEGLAQAAVIIGWVTTAIALIATALIIAFVVWASGQESGSSPTPLQTF